MEDIPRDVQKELERYTAPKKNRKARHWTLLFVGDQGEVITIRKFKGLMLLVIFIMVVALSAAVSIYMLYKKPFEENRRLEAALSESVRQVRILGEERDLLLTRLGIAESRLKKSQTPESEEAPVDQALSETTLPVSVEKPPEAVVAAAPETNKIRLQPVSPVKPEVLPPPVVTSAAKPEATPEIKPEIKIDVRDFQVRHDPAQKLLNVQFRLKNVNVEAGAVSGRTFVILENDQDDEAGVLTFPRVTLVDGKPGRIHLGRYFSISRFNIVKFNSAYEDSSRPLNSATVFVYSGAGDLLLEKRFSIENPFKETVLYVPETDESPANESGEPDDDQEGLEPENTILNN